MAQAGREFECQCLTYKTHIARALCVCVVCVWCVCVCVCVCLCDRGRDRMILNISRDDVHFGLQLQPGYTGCYGLLV